MKRRFLAATAALALAAVVTGCSHSVSSEPTDSGILVCTGAKNCGSVAIVQVPDGERAVRCVVLLGGSRGGISCDWAGAK